MKTLYHYSDIKKYCNGLVEMVGEMEGINNFLREENARLKKEYYQNEELKKLEEENALLREKLNRSFTITKDEENMIFAWKHNHPHETHSYIFTPTPIGTMKAIRCEVCGAEFTFTDV